MGSKKPKIGYQYFLGMHLVVCHSGDDLELKRITVGDREVWTGTASTNQTLSVNKSELFGGKRKEGGVAGDIDLLFGGNSQPVNTYLQGILGGVVPSFRGVFSLVFNKCYMSSMTPYIKPVKVKASRIYQGWYPSKAVINTDTVNPIHVVYDIITNNDWGMGFNGGDIDETSFQLAADTLHSEGFGICLVWRRSSTIEQFISMVMQHIDGSLTVDHTTGKFKIKLIRDDYTPASLPLFDESNVIEVSEFERASVADTVNEVVVTYHPIDEDEMRSVTVHDIANIQSQGAIVTQEKSYPGITDQATAQKVAERDLAVLSSPLSKISFKCDRSAWEIEVGDPIKVTWPDLGLTELIMRVTSVRKDDDRAGHIEIDAVEDVFALPSSTYMASQGSSWVNPLSPPLTISDYRLVELPYDELYRQLDGDDFANITDTTLYFAVLGAKKSEIDLFARLYTGVSTPTWDGEETVEHAPLSTLASDVNKTDATITINSTRDINSTFLDDDLPAVIVLNDELMLLTNISGTTLTVSRGICDTLPEDHTTGDDVWVLLGDGQLDPDPRFVDETLVYALENVNSLGSASLTSNIAASIPSSPNEPRQLRPPVPKNVAINAQSWPSEVTGDIAVTFVDRDRNDSSKQRTDWYSGTAGLEAGQTATVRIEGSGTGILHTETGITSGSYTYTMANELSTHGKLHGTITVKVWSERSGVVSSETFEHTFTRVTPAPTWDLTDNTPPTSDWDLTEGVLP